MAPFVKWFREIGLDDVDEVGGKNASLGEMYRYLSAAGVRVPDGFAVTADAYKQVVHTGEIDEKLHAALDRLDYDDVTALQAVGRTCRTMIEMAIEGARRNTIHSGICGQAPSDYSEVAEFLVRRGIDSISLNPDSVLRTIPRILRLEAEMREGE
jgi:phosphoenolpyruvate synthase/pyruvate phosphate dikinase